MVRVRIHGWFKVVAPVLSSRLWFGLSSRLWAVQVRGSGSCSWLDQVCGSWSSSSSSLAQGYGLVRLQVRGWLNFVIGSSSWFRRFGFVFQVVRVQVQVCGWLKVVVGSKSCSCFHCFPVGRVSGLFVFECQRYRVCGFRFLIPSSLGSPIRLFKSRIAITWLFVGAGVSWCSFSIRCGWLGRSWLFSFQPGVCPYMHASFCLVSWFLLLR